MKRIYKMMKVENDIQVLQIVSQKYDRQTDNATNCLKQKTKKNKFASFCPVMYIQGENISI